MMFVIFVGNKAYLVKNIFASVAKEPLDLLYINILAKVVIFS